MTVPQGPPVPPPPPYAGPYVAPPPTNGLAIASLVVSVIGLVVCGLGLPLAVAGIVLGVVALRRVATSGDRGRGLAIAGVTIGAVAAAMSLLLVVFLVWVGGQPVDTGSRDTVRATLSNAALAQQRYRAANDTYAPSLTALRTEDYRPTDGVAVTIRWANADGFCMEGVFGSAQLYVTQDDPPASGICAFADNPA